MAGATLFLVNRLRATSALLLSGGLLAGAGGGGANSPARIGVVGFARDAPQRVLLSSNETGRFQLYSLELGPRRRRRLTSLPAGKASGTISADGRWVYFLRDEGGSEIGRYVRVSFEGGKEEEIDPDSPPASGLGISCDRRGHFLVEGLSDGGGFRFRRVEGGNAPVTALPVGPRGVRARSLGRRPLSRDRRDREKKRSPLRDPASRRADGRARSGNLGRRGNQRHARPVVAEGGRRANRRAVGSQRLLSARDLRSREKDPRRAADRSSRRRDGRRLDARRRRSSAEAAPRGARLAVRLRSRIAEALPRPASAGDRGLGLGPPGRKGLGAIPELDDLSAASGDRRGVGSFEGRRVERGIPLRGTALPRHVPRRPRRRDLRLPRRPAPVPRERRGDRVDPRGPPLGGFRRPLAVAPGVRRRGVRRARAELPRLVGVRKSLRGVDRGKPDGAWSFRTSPPLAGF